MENLQLVVDWANRDLFTIFWGFAAAIIVFLLGRWLAHILIRSMSRYMRRAHLDPMVIRFAETLVFFALMAAVIVAALNQAGVHTTSLTALLAAAGVGIGLAIKDSLANLAAGVMILLYRPYTIHNFVDAGGANGLVEEVQVFSTLLRTVDNVQVIVPNSSILRGNIKNYSAYDTRRIDLPVSIRYEDSLAAARDRLMKIMISHPQVLATPAPEVAVLELAASSVNLVARLWVNTADYGQVRSELLEQIKLQLYESVLA